MTFRTGLLRARGQIAFIVGIIVALGMVAFLEGLDLEATIRDGIINDVCAELYGDESWPDDQPLPDMCITTD